MGGVKIVELPCGIENAAERWAKACKKDGEGNCDASVMVRDGEVLSIIFKDEDTSRYDFIFKYNGSYFKSEAVNR